VPGCCWRAGRRVVGAGDVRRWMGESLRVTPGDPGVDRLFVPRGVNQIGEQVGRGPIFCFR